MGTFPRCYHRIRALLISVAEAYRSSGGADRPELVVTQRPVRPGLHSFPQMGHGDDPIWRAGRPTTLRSASTMGYRRYAVEIVAMLVLGIALATLPSRGADAALGQDAFRIYTKSPKAHAAVGSSFVWEIGASKGAKPQSVKFFVDGVLKWTDQTEPFLFNDGARVLDTRTLLNGWHTLSATATRGTKRTSTSIRVKLVSNTRPPSPISPAAPATSPPTPAPPTGPPASTLAPSSPPASSTPTPAGSSAPAPSAPTPAPAAGGPTASVFVAPNGSDTGSNCVRFTSPRGFPTDRTTSARRSGGRIRLAAPGDTILVGNGNYGNQQICRGSTWPTCSSSGDRSGPVITLQAETRHGARVVGHLYLGLPTAAACRRRPISRSTAST